MFPPKICPNGMHRIQWQRAVGTVSVANGNGWYIAVNDTQGWEVIIKSQFFRRLRVRANQKNQKRNRNKSSRTTTMCPTKGNYQAWNRFETLVSWRPWGVGGGAAVSIYKKDTYPHCLPRFYVLCTIHRSFLGSLFTSKNEQEESDK